jgi:hypothetical protein
MIEVRGVDGRLLALLSADGLRLQIKRRNVVYEVDLVQTWVLGAAVTAVTDGVSDAGLCDPAPGQRRRG